VWVETLFVFLGRVFGGFLGVRWGLFLGGVFLRGVQTPPSMRMETCRHASEGKSGFDSTSRSGPETEATRKVDDAPERIEGENVL